MARLIIIGKGFNCIVGTIYFVKHLDFQNCTALGGGVAKYI